MEFNCKICERLQRKISKYGAHIVKLRGLEIFGAFTTE